MNKSISIYSFIITIFITVFWRSFAIAIPADSQAVSNNTVLQKANQITLNLSTKESKDRLIKIAFLASLVGTGTLFWKISQSRGGAKSRLKILDTQSNKALIDRVSPKLRRQLLRLVNDPKTANRLLMGIYKNNSHRSPNWIAEKAIYDLRRGR